MSRAGLSPARLEAFSDGVIAVIIIILVLELKVPQHDGIAGLRAVLPTVVLYLLTFVQIGIYWVNHHYLTDEVEKVSHGILWANLVFLFFLSLFPFATEWIGEKGLTSFNTALYAGVSIFPRAGLHAVVDADSQAKRRGPARKLGQAGGFRFAVRRGHSRRLAPACGFAGADRNGGCVVAGAAAAGGWPGVIGAGYLGYTAGRGWNCEV